MEYLKQTEERKREEYNEYGKRPETTRAVESSQQEDDIEKTIFLTPEEKYISMIRDGNDSSDFEQMPFDYGEESALGIPARKKRPDYLLRINETHTEALITLYYRREGECEFSLEELRALLEENGIVYGIREKTLEELAAGQHYYEEVLIAKGTLAKDGQDGFFEYHFNPRPETRPIILPDGSVDYNVLGKIELVKDGQLLVTYHPAIPATFGKDIYGNVVEAYEGKEFPPLQCKRCEPDEDFREYFACSEGNVTVEGNQLTVTPLYVVKGNLDAATGSVTFHGDVYVQGNVFAGVTVKTTGSITVNGHVETASLLAGKDVILTNGMQGAGSGVIRAGRNVMARFLEQIKVYAGNEINTGALLNCEVESGGSVIISGNRGTIIGGSTTAVELISAASLGNHAGVNTQLIIGLDRDFKLKMDEIDRLTKEYQDNLMDAAQTLERITYQLMTQPLTPELSQEKTEQTRRKIHYQSKLKEISTKRVQLIDINQRSAGGKIVISGMVYVGCTIIMNGVREVLQSEYRNITFKKTGPEIRIISNKL